jgi:hypothetical protein
LPLEWIERCGLSLHILSLYGTSLAARRDPDTIAWMVQSAMRGEDVSERVELELGFETAHMVVDPAALVHELRSVGGSDETVRAAAALVLLKAHRIPARPIDTVAGPGVEVWREGAWHPLDLDPPPPDPSEGVAFGLAFPRELGKRAATLVGD